MNLEKFVEIYYKQGYELNSAQAKVAQDIILLKLSESKYKDNITIKGGVVMHNISHSMRRATRDIDLDFIKYSLDNNSIYNFIETLNKMNDNVQIQIEKIIALKHEDYNGKRVYVKIIDKYNYYIETKLDIGVHKLFQIKQEQYYFNLSIINEEVTLLINSSEQIFTEKLKSLLKLGINSTRYKDVFDLYYLIKCNKLDKNKLLFNFKIIIFDNNQMRENSLDDIIIRLIQIFNSNIYMKNLINPKVNWIDKRIDVVTTFIINYLKNLK